MARKKAQPDDLTPTTTDAPQEQPKKPARSKKAASAPAEATVAAPPKVSRRSRKSEDKAAQVVAAAEPVLPEPATPPAAKASRGTRTRKGPTPDVPAPATVVQVEDDVKKVTRGSRSKKAPAKEAPKAEPPAEKNATPEQPRPRSRRGRGNKGASVEAAASPNGSNLGSIRSDFRVDDLGEDMPVPTWRPRQPGRLAPAAQAESSPGEEREAEPRDERRGRRRRRSGRGDKAMEITAEGAIEVPASTSFSNDEDVMVSFRSREGKAPSVAVEVSKETPARDANRRERGGRGRRSAPVPEESAAPAPTATPQPEIPATLVRKHIAVPEDAPQIVLRDGVPTLVRQHRVYPPMLFFGSSTDERRAQTVLDELKMAAEAGIHLHSHLVEFEVDPQAVDASVAVAAYMLKKTLEIDPQSQVIFRVVFQAPRNWQSKYPNAKWTMEVGGVAEPSVCDDDFWGVAKTCLQTFVKKLRLLEQRDHILGVHLERGEWFIAAGWGYDDSQAAKAKFRDWARQRYLNDEVTLRASWFDGNIRFDNIVVPRYMPHGSEGDKFVRSSRKQRKYVDYHLFLSDATVQRIADLAYAVKESTEGYFLVGVSYGYTFEWSHPASGHLSLGKLLRTPEIDFIAGPPSYKSREPGGTAAFPGPVDSYALNGKLYISEEDFKTSLSGGHEPDDFNPVIKTPQALENIHWRGAGAALAHGSGIAWMDLWGNGWLKTPSIWQRGKQLLTGLIDRMATPIGEPEVVVFIDERALAYLVDQNAFGLLVQNVRESVLRAGVSAGFYLLSDLAHRERFPEAKLYLFVNAWDIRPELRAAIKSRLQRDNKVLFWLYSAGLFDAGRDSLERAREVTGIALKPQPFHSKSGTTMLARRHPLTAPFPDRHLGGDSQLEPSYFAIPEDATVLGEYSQTGLPSFVVKDFATEGQPDLNWTSVFLGEPTVNPALIRALAQMAGAHVYNFHEDVVHVRPPFLTVHCTGTGQRSIALPNKWSAYNLIEDSWVSLDHTMLRFTGIDGTTHNFLVGPREELQHLLDSDKSDLLTMAKLPPKQENEFRQDGLAFDVPIMKLGEWIETSDSEESADEWFLRPQQIIDEPEGESEKVGRRRGRRRRDRGGRPGSEETSSARPEPSGTVVSEEFDEDLGMSVMFRKRD